MHGACLLLQARTGDGEERPGDGGGTRLRLPSLQVREEVRTEPDGVCKPNHRMVQDEGAEWRPRR